MIDPTAFHHTRRTLIIRAVASIALLAPVLSTMVAAMLGAPPIAMAQERAQSDWAIAQSASMRLVSGKRAADGGLRAGIEIRLAPGYKTYWRSAGDSGVPPHLSFEGSDNLDRADVLFPAPHVYEDAAGKAIGYKDHVVWPVHVLPKDPGLPVRLALHLDYGVCDKLCIPADGSASLNLTGQATADSETLIADAERLVPKPVAIGASGALRIDRIGDVTMLEGRSVFTVDTASEDPATLLAESRPNTFFADATATGRSSDGRQSFAVTVYDPETGRHRLPCDITLTLVSAKGGIETPARLDGCTPFP